MEEPSSSSDSDSPLSATSNILSILTFAYALLASALLFLATIRTADAEMHQLLSQVRQTTRHIDTLTAYFHGLDLVADPDLVEMREPIRLALKDWRRTNAQVSGQVEGMRRVGMGVRRRVGWFLERREVMAGVERGRSEKEDLAALLLTYLLRFVRNFFFLSLTLSHSPPPPLSLSDLLLLTGWTV